MTTLNVPFWVGYFSKTPKQQTSRRWTCYLSLTSPVPKAAVFAAPEEIFLFRRRAMETRRSVAVGVGSAKSLFGLWKDAIWLEAMATSNQGMW